MPIKMLGAHGKRLTCRLLSVCALCFLIVCFFVTAQTRGASEGVSTSGSIVNPVTLFEVPGEINVTFRVVSGDTYFSRVELQLGESVGFEVT